MSRLWGCLRFLIAKLPGMKENKRHLVSVEDGPGEVQRAGPRPQKGVDFSSSQSPGWEWEEVFFWNWAHSVAQLPLQHGKGTFFRRAAVSHAGQVVLALDGHGDSRWLGSSGSRHCAVAPFSLAAWGLLTLPSTRLCCAMVSHRLEQTAQAQKSPMPGAGSKPGE